MADIFVDDDFFGNTPSTLSIAAGKHFVTVRKAGFQAWVRTVSLNGGSVTLNAELVRGADETLPASAPAATSNAKGSTATPTAVDLSQKPDWIGVHAQSSGDVAVVNNVNPDSPGEKAGIHVGDVILALDGRLIKGKDFETAVAALKPGMQIAVSYARGSVSHEVSVIVGSQN